LDRMGNRKSDKGLFPLRKGAFGKYRVVVVKKLLCQLRRLLTNIWEFGQVFGLVIRFPDIPPLVLPFNFALEMLCAYQSHQPFVGDSLKRFFTASGPQLPD
jgi:hypothetical protein